MEELGRGRMGGKGKLSREQHGQGLGSVEVWRVVPREREKPERDGKVGLVMV